MELLEDVRQTLRGGRTGAKFNEYLRVYKLITGKDYPNKNCTGCATKYLHRFLEHWYETNKIKV